MPVRSDPGHILALTAAVAEALQRRGQTLAVAESACGGLLCSTLTDLPGSSRWFRAGVVAYSNHAKEHLLGVGAALLAAEGAVSQACAAAMAAGARTQMDADWGLAETGIAGPQTGRRSAKSAGLAYLAVAGPGVTREMELRSGLDDRAANKRAFVAAALELLLAALDTG